MRLKGENGIAPRQLIYLSISIRHCWPSTPQQHPQRGMPSGLLVRWTGSSSHRLLLIIIIIIIGNPWINLGGGGG